MWSDNPLISSASVESHELRELLPTHTHTRACVCELEKSKTNELFSAQPGHAVSGWSEVAPAVVSAVPKLVSIKATGLNVKVDPSDAEEDASEDEVSTTMPAQDSASLPGMPSAASQDPAAAGEEEFRVSAAGFSPVMV